MDLNVLRDWEQAEFEGWILIEYPDVAEEFSRLPKTLAELAGRRYNYLIREFIDNTRLPAREGE